MPSLTESTSTAEHSSLFVRLGSVIVRWPWLVIGIWLAIAAALPLTFPSLTLMVQQRPVAILPSHAPVTVATREMTEAFHESGSENVLLVVLSNDKGLGPADEATYRKLVDDLRKNHTDVVMLQDFISAPPLREFMASKDGKAWILPVGIAGDVGSPQSYASYTRVADIVKNSVQGASLTASLTGPAATVADLTDIGERDTTAIEIATIAMVLVILLLIYRNPVTMLLPLLTIGASLVTAQSVIAGLAYLGMGISNQTVVFLTAMMAGAGTDYAVFLISRYHDYLRDGLESDRAVEQALGSIGKVIAASAATVAVTFLGMMFAQLGLFSTVGTALAVAIGIALLAALTLLPAVMVLVGRRGWIAPRRDLTSRIWRRSGIRIVRRPWSHLAASLVVLAALASCATLVQYNYDDRKALPAHAESSMGYAALEDHFPISSAIPQYLIVQSPNELRTPQALADLEQMAQRVSQLPGVAVVRGITRPTGESLQQARLSYQAGEVGTKLNDASTQINGRASDLNRLTDGADTLATSLLDVRTQVTRGVAGARGLVDALATMQKQVGGNTTLQQIDSAAKLVSSMRALGDSLDTNFADLTNGMPWIDPVLRGLDTSPVCLTDPACLEARGSLRRLAAARTDGTFDQIAALARDLRATDSMQTLEDTVKKLSATIDTASKAMQSMGLANPAQARSQLNTLQSGADNLADASRQIADGVSLLVSETKRVGSGLDEASAFLLNMKTDAASPPMSGFYVPAQILTQDEFRKAAATFISPDGHTARYLIQTDINPFGTEAMNLVNSIGDTARGALPNTALEGSSVSIAGYPAMLRDTRDFYNHDIRLIIAITIAVVLLILVVLLRAFVAPLYLIASVVISYLSALGIGVVMFQYVLGQQLHWSVPALTFIVLVAVGADYNLLLISRIRDESPHGVRSGVIRTVGSTGGVITAAGLIFAASMFGLLFASITTVVQAGFVVGVGILLDTFLVRTMTVPAIATLMGTANWWPSDFVTRQLDRVRSRLRVGVKQEAEPGN